MNKVIEENVQLRASLSRASPPNPPTPTSPLPPISELKAEQEEEEKEEEEGDELGPKEIYAVVDMSKVSLVLQKFSLKLRYLITMFLPMLYD